jgi:hypothetical protein
MTQDESAQMGANDAARLCEAITSSLNMVGVSKVYWWGGFMAALAAQCHNSVGAEAHAIIQGVTANALKVTTGGTVQ